MFSVTLGLHLRAKCVLGVVRYCLLLKKVMRLVSLMTDFEEMGAIMYYKLGVKTARTCC